jgi:uncharacterized protein YqhQ
MARKPLEHHAPYGGQAVIEGVMMRSPRFFAVACRRPSGDIVVEQEPVEGYLKKFMWLNIPFLRGTLALIDSFAMGIKALTFSANVAMEQEQQSSQAQGTTQSPDLPTNQSSGSVPAKSQPINDMAVNATMFLGLVIGVGVFIVIPHALTSLLGNHVIHSGRSIWLNIIDGLVRICLFVGYIAAISTMKDIRRVFQYHGAEHKVINTMEAGLELTPENFSKFSTIHPRCGTAFITFVLVLSIIIFSVALGWRGPIWERILTRLAFLPVIAGIGYEMIRLVGRFKDSKVLRALLMPGLWLQKITTREPTADQVEVALAALNAVIAKEEACAVLGQEDSTCDAHCSK